ncbi:hypothetical protein EDD18DRAFT_1109658 [Armillaria luteobubalina]|uniref:Uncharacterized protein n=1 Tax=Armillaria luteobubalina TaxID=153913 RepID=A0AA39PTX4_9AGAR|nr:hypothetical protein EDD18DRAFT_1109658 [Armillaria luteobubalina]
MIVVVDISGDSAGGGRPWVKEEDQEAAHLPVADKMEGRTHLDQQIVQPNHVAGYAPSLVPAFIMYDLLQYCLWIGIIFVTSTFAQIQWWPWTRRNLPTVEGVEQRVLDAGNIHSCDSEEIVDKPIPGYTSEHDILAGRHWEDEACLPCIAHSEKSRGWRMGICVTVKNIGRRKRAMQPIVA